MAAKKGVKKESKIPPAEQGLHDKIAKLLETKNPGDETKQRIKLAKQELAGMRFLRLATPRVNKAINAIAGIGKLTGNGYAFTPDQAEKIIGAISDATASIARKFEGTKEEKQTFSL